MKALCYGVPFCEQCGEWLPPNHARQCPKGSKPPKVNNTFDAERKPIKVEQPRKRPCCGGSGAIIGPSKVKPIRPKQ